MSSPHQPNNRLASGSDATLWEAAGHLNSFRQFQIASETGAELSDDEERHIKQCEPCCRGILKFAAAVRKPVPLESTDLTVLATSLPPAGTNEAKVHKFARNKVISPTTLVLAGSLLLMLVVSVSLLNYFLTSGGIKSRDAELSRLNGIVKRLDDDAQSARNAMEEQVRLVRQLRQSLTDEQESRSRVERLLDTVERQRLTPEEFGRQPIFVSFLSGPATDEPSGTIKLEVVNDRFPCYLSWRIGEKLFLKRQIVYAGRSEVEVPAGDVNFYLEPVHNGLWLQPVGIIRITGNQAQSIGSSLGKVNLTVEKGERLVLFADQPSAPWNAVCLPVKGAWAIVTLERPWASFHVERWLRGEKEGPEEFPNTPLLWAKHGTKILAAELAHTVVEQRPNAGQVGRFRGKMHTSIVVGATEKGPVEPFASISEADLTEALIPAFEVLMRQRPPVGLSVADEIKAATDILKTKEASEKK